MKVLFAGLKYDYGIPERGVSLESKTIIPGIIKVADEYNIFWLEDNGFPNNLDLLQKNLINYANEVEPNVVFFGLMKDEIYKDTLKYLKSKYIVTNWFCDDTWRFDDFSSEIAPFLTIAITNDKFSLKKYEKIGCKALLTQWATIDYEEDKDLQNIDYKYDISFVGSKNPTRAWIVEELRKNNLIVHCFGAGWENGRVTFEEMKNIFYKSKINLNLSNSVSTNIEFLKYAIINLFRATIKVSGVTFKQYLRNGNLYYQSIKFFFFGNKTREQVKARNFEIPGWAGFQISQYALELEDYYEIGRELAVFNSPDELIKQCYYYLDNEDLRKKICQNGHKRTKEYTYIDRLGKILEGLKQIS